MRVVQWFGMGWCVGNFGAFVLEVVLELSMVDVVTGVGYGRFHAIFSWYVLPRTSTYVRGIILCVRTSTYSFVLCCVRTLLPDTYVPGSPGTYAPCTVFIRTPLSPVSYVFHAAPDPDSDRPVDKQSRRHSSRRDPPAPQLQRAQLGVSAALQAAPKR